MLQATTQSTAIQEGRHRDARSNYGITCPTTAANGKYSLPYPFAALLFAAEGTAPLVDSRTSEATEAVAKRPDSRRREGRDGRETAAEEEVHEGRRRGGRWGRGEGGGGERGGRRHGGASVVVCGWCSIASLILVSQRESRRTRLNRALRIGRVIIFYLLV
jgi:hypothetical protein